MIVSRKIPGFTAAFAAVLVVVFVLGAVAAPSGSPIKIGGTLALTGPLAATALLHKITAEIFVEELNRGNGLLGRPVEWVLLDDQSKPEVTNNPSAARFATLYHERAAKAGVPYTNVDTQAAGSYAAWQMLEASVTATKSLDDKVLPSGSGRTRSRRSSAASASTART